eukprot:Nk52_evm12s312 gene=Nk52_evmTU12s312
MKKHEGYNISESVEIPVDADKDTPQKRNFPMTFEVVAIISYIALDRAAFYGFTLAALQYLLTMFQMSSQSANLLLSVYLMMVNYLGVAGSYLSDAHFGKWTVTLSTGILYVFGLTLTFASALPAAWTDFPSSPGTLVFIIFFLGAGLVAIAKCSKMVFTALLAEQVEASSKDPKTVERVFLWYTAALNGGPAISMFLVPYLYTLEGSKQYGDRTVGTAYYFSFGLATFLCLLGLAVYCIPRRKYVNIEKFSEKGEESPFVKAFRAVSTGYRNKKLAKRQLKEAPSAECRQRNSMA